MTRICIRFSPLTLGWQPGYEVQGLLVNKILPNLHECLFTGLPYGVGVSVGVSVSVGDGASVGVRVSVGVTVGVSDAVGVGVNVTAGKSTGLVGFSPSSSRKIQPPSYCLSEVSGWLGAIWSQVASSLRALKKRHVPTSSGDPNGA